jgi:hypothetical protein
MFVAPDSEAINIVEWQQQGESASFRLSKARPDWTLSQLLSQVPAVVDRCLVSYDRAANNNREYGTVHGRSSHDFLVFSMAVESPALLRLFANGCRSTAASATDREAVEMLEDMARELERRADELEAGLASGSFIRGTLSLVAPAPETSS